MSEYIRSAAIQDRTGRVWTLSPPSRHNNIFQVMKERGASHIGAIQGFITNNGRFVDRKIAFQIAKAANQLGANAVVFNMLFTEDLW